MPFYSNAKWMTGLNGHFGDKRLCPSSSPNPDLSQIWIGCCFFQKCFRIILKNSGIKIQRFLSIEADIRYFSNGSRHNVSSRSSIMMGTGIAGTINTPNAWEIDICALYLIMSAAASKTRRHMWRYQYQPSHKTIPIHQLGYLDITSYDVDLIGMCSLHLWLLMEIPIIVGWWLWWCGAHE